MLYVDRLTVVFAFAGIFALGIWFTTQDVLLFAIAGNFTCGVEHLLVVGSMIN